MNSRAIVELVFHLGRIATGEGLAKGLTAAQWAVLRYFSQANRFSRPPSPRSMARPAVPHHRQ